MMARAAALRLVLAVSMLGGLAASARAQAGPEGGGPILVVETTKGTFEIETFPDEAPKTVARVLDLVRRHFYSGLRFHRAVPGFIIQVGDPQTRDVTKKESWGRGQAAGSGTPIGVAEISRKRLHGKGAVAMAHTGDPAKADSQFYVTLAAKPELNGKYTVWGQVIAGAEVPEKIQVGDLIREISVKP